MINVEYNIESNHLNLDEYNTSDTDVIHMEIDDYVVSISPQALEYTTTIVYQSVLTPPPVSVYVTPNLDGVSYSGTLYLQNYVHANGKTIATYKGTLHINYYA